MKDVVIEYELENLDGELINCFTWHELRMYFSAIAPSTLKSAYLRHTVLMGKYLLTQVRYAQGEN